MKLFIKNMISVTAKTRALAVMKSLGLHPVVADIGEVEIPDIVSSKKYDLLRRALRREDFEVVNDKETILVEKIRYVVIEMIHYTEEFPETNFSDYISTKLHLDYTHLSRCFSRTNNITIQQFIIAQKIERVKNLLLYADMTLSEIAWKLQYSSTSHLSSQFKKVTGLSPSDYKKMMINKN
jgi:AraC-like DNA-binding protein